MGGASSPVTACLAAAATAAIAIAVPILVGGPPLLILSSVTSGSIVVGLALLTAYVVNQGTPIDWYVPGIAVVAACWLAASPILFDVTDLAAIQPGEALLLYSTVASGGLAIVLLTYATYTSRGLGSLSAIDQPVS